MAMTFRMSVLSLSLFYLYAGASAHLLRRRERVHAVRRHGLHGHGDLGAVAPAGRGPGARDLNGVLEHSDGRASPARYEHNAQQYASNPRIISSLLRSAGDAGVPCSQATGSTALVCGKKNLNKRRLRFQP